MILSTKHATLFVLITSSGLLIAGGGTMPEGEQGATKPSSYEGQRSEHARRETDAATALFLKGLMDKGIIKQCPRCTAPIEKNGGSPRIGCTQCRYSFCWDCLAPWNMDRHQCSAHCRDQYRAQEGQRSEHARRETDGATALFLKGLMDKGIIKQCPRCIAPIEKDGGSPRMMCNQCNHGFCWDCLAPWEMVSFRCSARCRDR